MRTKFRSLVLAVAFLLFAGNGASAALIGSTDGLVDTDTGLEWLNVVVNENLSYNDMIASNLNGFGAFGYRYATVFEVGELFENAGATLPALGGFSSDPANQAAGDLLIGFLGANFADSNQILIQAVSGTLATANLVYAPWIRGSGPATGLSYGNYTPLLGQQSPYLGHYLVRPAVSPVPLPAALPLFLTMLAGMAGLRWWRRRTTAA